MPLDPPFVVRIEPDAGSSLSVVMTELRSWFDYRKIQPSLFQPVFQNGVVRFEIGFRSEDEAELFRQQFGGVPSKATTQG